MKILWFAHTPSNFAPSGAGQNGGGWVTALESEIRGKVELAHAFLSDEADPYGRDSHEVGRVKWEKIERGGVMYYPIHDGWETSRLSSPYGTNFRQHIQDLRQVFSEIVADFRPDAIEVFGSEHSYGLVASGTAIPVVLHVQGIVEPYYRHYLPPEVGWGRYILSSPSLKEMARKYAKRVWWEQQCELEREMFLHIRNYLARTDWDHEQIRRVNPNARFFYGGEILRQPFYDADIEAISEIPSALKLVSTVSEPPYKGFDVILRTAHILRTEYMLDFEWKVYGSVRPAFFEKITKLKSEEVGVTVCGLATAAELVDAMSRASMYVHPSYIDNSPNSVCEAQLLGAAVVATSVGGVPSLIDDGQTGFLVHSGRPDEIAERIVALYRNKALLRKVGRQGREVAMKRHDRAKIVSDLMDVYGKLTEK